MNPEQQSPWQWTHDGPQLGFARAFARFRGVLESAWTSPEDGAAVAETFARCAEAMQEPLQAPEAAERIAQSFATYHEALRAATLTPEARRLVREALHEYVADLIKAWAAVPPDNLAAADLVAIAQSMSWIANVAVDIENA